ncbi:hypothetical protein ABT234_11655 [Streptomyces sp. NPDC001586]|uniref:hypothetical protein n=1 Tax=Streptomyces sp. NPDC001586 TaxID=3154387 RepID=UPI00332207CE
MTNPLDVPRRRALVAQMSRDKVPIRTMAALLGVSKDVVHRDRQTLAAAPAETPAARRRQRVADTTATLGDLRDTAEALVKARPAYQMGVDDETAARWYAELRDTTARLAALAATFGEYYPHLTDPTATPSP